MRLKNKSALITGGTSGIGLATARLFIAEGARVAVTGRDDAVFERVKAELGENALVLKGDVRSIGDMRAIAAEVSPPTKTTVSNMRLPTGLVSIERTVLPRTGPPDCEMT